jgi:predicted dehydrogenase
MKKLFRIVSILWEVYRDGTLLGTIRYICYMRLKTVLKSRWRSKVEVAHGVGIVGAGSYVASIHLPCLRALGEPLYAVASLAGDSARALAKLYSIGVVYQTLEEMATDPRCEAILIATPHYLHAKNILTVLDARKYSYCEKPVAIDYSDLDRLETYGLGHSSAFRVMIGFNRRFSPAVVKLRSAPWLRIRTEPIEIHYRINFGQRVDNMMSDPVRGGGRIHGAVCHYVDMIAFLANSSIVQVSALAIADGDDNTFVAIMKLEDGSLASMTFTSEGVRDYDTKEEIMISSDQHVARIRNYSELKIDNHLYKFKRHTYGAMAAMRAFLEAKKTGANTPISLADGVAATRVTLALQKSLRMNGEPQVLQPVPGTLQLGRLG